MVEHVEELSSAVRSNRKEACRPVCAVSHETWTRSNRTPQTEAQEHEGRGWRVKSIFVIAVNQPPYINSIISVCFPRASPTRQTWIRFEIIQVPVCKHKKLKEGKNERINLLKTFASNIFISISVFKYVTILYLMFLSPFNSLKNPNKFKNSWKFLVNKVLR